MAEKKENPNTGHRQRMRERYLTNGLSGFQPHEVLELLLFYALPRRDTNKIAHTLIRRFHTISGVFEADKSELMQVEGINENTAIFLKLLPELCRVYQMSKNSDRIAMKRRKEFETYIGNLYIGAVKEQVYVLCLDAQMRLICTEKAGEGSSNAANLRIRTVAEIALRNRCHSIILAHNHPDGTTEPSSADLFVTRRLHTALRALEITLEDHFIVGDKVISLRDAGYWDAMM